MGVDPADKAADSDAKGVIVRTVKSLGFLRGLFSTKRGWFTFILLGLAYMVCNSDSVTWLVNVSC